MILKLLDELDALHALLQPAFFASVKRPRRVRLGATDEVYLVAEGSRGEVHGLAHVHIFDLPADPPLAPARRAYLDDLIVERPHRRVGHGRALMRAAEAWASEHGATQIVLTLWEGNEPTERFYEALGYGLISHVRGRELGGSHYRTSRGKTS